MPKLLYLKIKCEMRRHCITYFFGWAIAIVAMAHPSRAQLIPGRWHKVVLPQGLAGTNTQDFAFHDSLNGICFSNYGLISSTTNGGRTWAMDTNLSGITPGYNLNSVECTGPHRGFFYSGNYTLSISPSATVIRKNPNVIGFDYGLLTTNGSYVTIAEKMYDTLYGFRLAYVFTHDPAQLYEDTFVLLILVSHDGWQSASIYRTAYKIPFDPSFQNEMSFFTVGCIVDSNDIWIGKGDGVHPYGTPTTLLLHTSNGGMTWNSIDAFDSARYQPQVLSISINSKTREIYCMMNGSSLDFAYSSDYGKTWQLDSTYGTIGYIDSTIPKRFLLNVWRMANPAPKTLWAMFGEGGGNVIGDKPPDATFGPYNDNDYSRTIGYSTDNGHTWLIDSTTFRDDSLEEMHWLDARHGWIASWSHDSLWMWYYDADGTNSVVEHHQHSTPAYSLLYPDPVSTTLKVDAPGLSGQIVVEDILGREVLRSNLPRSGQAELDVRTLPSGPYMAIVGNLVAQFIKE